MTPRRRTESGTRTGALWLLGATLALTAMLALVPVAAAAGLRSESDGASGVALAAAGMLDGPALFQAACTWLALFAMIFWVGGVIWEAWVLPPGGSANGELDAAVVAAARRFRALAPYALGLAFLADFGALRFGSFWWLRQFVVLGALALAVQAARQDVPVAAGAAPPLTRPLPATSARPGWRGELTATLRGVGELSDRIVLGWRRLRPPMRLELLLGAALIVAFALSGQDAGVPAAQTSYALLVDALQLLAEAAWLGGLFYLAVVLLPVSMRLAPRLRAMLLALGLPEFGALALVAGVLFVVTGALNAKLRLSTFQELLTTTYGRTFIVEFELFLIMVAISAYFALYLHPRLAAELGEGSPRAATETPSGERVAMSVPTQRGSGGSATRTASRGDQAGSGEQPPSRRGRSSGESEPPLTPRAESLEERIRDWLRRQALLGGAVLLCVALLGIFAGSLMSAAPAPSTTASVTPTPFSGQQSIEGLDMRLMVSPDVFGTNTFAVAVKDIAGHPVTGATVSITLTSTDMDMGTATIHLQPAAGVPGSYSAQAVISMAGHWRAVVHVTPSGATTSVITTFTFTVGY